MDYEYEPFPFKKHIIWGFITLGVWHLVWPFLYLAHPSKAKQVKKAKKQQAKAEKARLKAEQRDSENQ